jgi:4-hydroxy-4-methyl-2-oxoglutarate aldolase
MNKIFASIERPDPALVERYRSVLQGQLVKVMSPGQIMDDAIKPLAGRKVRIAGPAVTAVSDHPDFMVGILATGVAKAGDVIVIAPRDPSAGAAWGAGLTISTDILKCEGVVVDGFVTDADHMLACATPVFCRGSVNVDAKCGGVRIRAGDLIVGDLDGVCVVPAEDIERLIEPLEAISRQILEGADKMRADAATIFDRMGGEKLARDLGIEWCA